MAAHLDRRIAGRGTSEAGWLSSPGLVTMAKANYRDVVAGATRLVVVAPHPDDEVLGCGGLMATAADAGLPIVVVSLTQGERCYPDDPHWTAQRIAVARQNEVRNAMRTLGVVHPDIRPFCIEDGQLRDAIDRAATSLHALLTGDDLVLVTWQWDGHPDHEAAYEAARLATERARCRLLQFPVWGWHWSDPASSSLLHDNAVRMDLDFDVRRRKRSAISAFATQTGQCVPAVAEPTLPPHVIARFSRPFEVFLR